MNQSFVKTLTISRIDHDLFKCQQTLMKLLLQYVFG